mgnify:CR=1 FL=1
MSSGQIIEIVDNTWPALQRAENIFGSRTDTTFRGDTPNHTVETKKGEKSKKLIRSPN